MKNIWAPWRSAYVVETEKHQDGCIFCAFPREGASSFRERLILYCDDHVFVILNRYPYNPGHLMVIPRAHVTDMSQLEPHVFVAWMECFRRAVSVVERVLGSHGINTGMNLGKAAGAGIPQHIHLHVVPRWQGDTNFMPVVAETKVVSQGLYEIYDLLHPFFS